MSDSVFPPTEPVRAAAVPPEPTHRLPIGTELGGLRITGVIGEGGFGVVYLAFDPTLQRQVALKEYMPMSLASRARDSAEVTVRSERFVETFNAGLRSFVNEARLLAHFDHPALVKVHQFWQANRTAYMVMPYYQGPTLKAHVQELAARGSTPDEAQLRRWIDPLLDALELMHAENCYHRDIAPDNILLTARGPLLLDFGAARRVISDMTHALTVILKPGYAPIEQYGEAASMAQGPWTDLYALASVVYFAITGRSPITSVERLMGDPLPRLAQVAAGRYGERFLHAIDTALSVRPKERPQSVAEFRALLDEAPRATTTTLAAPADARVDASATANDRTVTRVLPPAASPPPPAPAATSVPTAAPVSAAPATPVAGATTPKEPPAPKEPMAPAAAPARRGLWIGAAAVAALLLAAGLAGVVRRDDGPAQADAAPGGAQPTSPAPTPVPGATAATPGAAATPSPPVATASPPPTTAIGAGTETPAATRPAAAPPPAPVPAPSVRATPPAAAVAPRPAPPPPARAAERTAVTGSDAATGGRAATPPKADDATLPAGGSRPAPSSAAPDSGRTAAAAAPATPARPARCDELLRKGSQQPLTLDEANFLRQACR